MKEGRRSEGLPVWAWLVLPLGMAASIPLARILNPDFHERWYNQKEGPIEWLTVVVLFLAVYAGLRAWRDRHVLPTRWLRGWLAVLILGSFYMGAEEISWGQTFFQWESPEFFLEVNRQDETNLHNTSSWFDRKPRILFEVWVLVGGIFYALRARRRSWDPDDWRGWFWPPFACFPVAVVAILTRVPDRIEKWISEFDNPVLVDLRLSEPQELFFGYFLMVLLFSLCARMHARASMPEVAGAASRGEDFRPTEEDSGLSGAD